MKRAGILVLILAAVCLAAMGQSAQSLSPEQQAKLESMRAEIAANGWTFTVGPNEAMQYRLEDLCGARPELAPASFWMHHASGPAILGSQAPSAESLPSAYVGWVSAIRNQGQCGSCWAFGTIGELEAVYLKENGAPQAYLNGSGNVVVSGSVPDTAEQQVLSCNPWGYSCGGGWYSFDMLMPSQGYYPGAMPETCFPYVASDVACAYCGNPTWTPVTDWDYTPDNSVATIKQAIYTYGAVLVSVYVDGNFQAYTGGVFNACVSTSSINHTIVLCGWDDSKGAWLLKNSWGTGWGIGGFMWITYGCSNVGYEPAWATSNGAPGQWSITGTVSGDVVSGVTVTLGGAASATTTTAADGTFSFTGLHDGSFSVTPSKSGYTFSPASRNVGLSGASQTGVNFASTLIAYSVSGSVIGAGSSGVTITATGTTTASTVTGSGGAYKLQGLPPGNYTLTPSKSGYAFTPPSCSIIIHSFNVTGVNFSSVAGSTYGVSGTVSGAIASGVTVTLSGAASATATTASGGSYTFSGLVNGSYTVTPSKAGYTFAPPAQSVTISSANKSGIDFTSSAGTTYSISGTVSGAIATGVTMTLGGAGSATTTTGTGGTYSFGGLVNGSYTVTPSRSGYTFIPTNRAVLVSGASVPGQDFTASATGSGYAFLDDQGRSKLCLNGATGAYAWTILSGAGAGASYSGTAKITNTATNLTLASLAGDPQFITLNFNKTMKTATGSFRVGSTTSILSDKNTANDPAGLCP